MMDEKTEKSARLDKILTKSKLTEADIERHSKIVKERMWKQHRALLKGKNPSEFEKLVKLKDDRIAEIRFLSPKDQTHEFQQFIHEIIDENAYIIHSKKPTLKEEEKWKQTELEKQKKGDGLLLVARVDGKLAGTSGANRDRGKASHHVMIGIALAKEYRGVGLGQALLRTNIEMSKKLLKPKVISLDVFAPNKPARALYEKVGFVQFGLLPKALLYKGRFVDRIFMMLK